MSNSIDSVVDGAINRLPERQAEGTEKDPKSTAAGGTEKSADLLNLTGRAQALKALEEELARSPEFDSQRVGELKEALASGRYEVNAERIAEKLLAMESKLP